MKKIISVLGAWLGSEVCTQHAPGPGFNFQKRFKTERLNEYLRTSVPGLRMAEARHGGMPLKSQHLEADTRGFLEHGSMRAA